MNTVNPVRTQQHIDMEQKNRFEKICTLAKFSTQHKINQKWPAFHYSQKKKIKSFVFLTFSQPLK